MEVKRCKLSIKTSLLSLKQEHMLSEKASAFNVNNLEPRHIKDYLSDNLRLLDGNFHITDYSNPSKTHSSRYLPIFHEHEYLLAQKSIKCEKLHL